MNWNYTNEEAIAVLNIVARGCEEGLERQKQLHPVPKQDAEMEKQTDVEAGWLMNEGAGADVGQSAAEAFVQSAKQEQELDNMKRS